ncbi:MAG: hypothetical protein KKG00_15630 [Bacteroidetes bacterium]|nr:hypothetical protein [Bacteroidota bacterium]
MTSKISMLLIQTLFFFLAITFMSFFAEAMIMASKGEPLCSNFGRWIAAEFTPNKVLLRLAASGIYVLIRNRRILFKG